MEILYILLGWLLGILGPGIVSYISTRYKKKALLKVIYSEMTDIKKRLANIPLLVYPKYGILTIETFNWIKENTNNFISSTKTDVSLNEKLRKLDNPEYVNEIIMTYNATHREDNPGFGFKKMFLNVFDSNLINISILDDASLCKLLDIKYQINSLNEEIQRIYDYMKLTYDGNISSENHSIISSEIKKSNLFIAERAILIVNKINSLYKA